MNKVFKVLLLALVFISLISVNVSFAAVISEQIDVTENTGYKTLNKAKHLLHKKPIRTTRTVRNLHTGDIYSMDYISDNELAALLKLKIQTQEDLEKNINKLLFSPDINVELTPNLPFGNGLITKNKNHEVLVGRNYNTSKTHPSLVFWSEPRTGYKNITITDAGLLNFEDSSLHDEVTDISDVVLAPYYTIDGMNEKGLVISVFKDDSDEVNQNNVALKNYTTPEILVRAMLEKCDSVVHAIRFVKKYNISSKNPVQILIVDKNGHFALLKYRKNKLVVTRVNNSKLFSKEPSMSEEDALKYLSQTVYSQNRGAEPIKDGITNWSILFNPKQQCAYFTIRENFERIYSITLDDEDQVEQDKDSKDNNQVVQQ